MRFSYGQHLTTVNVKSKHLRYFETNSKKSLYRINRFISDEEVSNLFSKAYIVVYPYRSITMSGVLSISYYFKKQLLVSNHSFFKDNTDLDALFFISGDVNDLSLKLAEICDRNYIKTGSSFYEKNYKKSILIDEYMKFYLLG